VLWEGGVDRYHSHWHLLVAKFHVLMYKEKYGAVIGYKSLTSWKLRLSSYKNVRFLATHSAVFALAGTSKHEKFVR